MLPLVFESPSPSFTAEDYHRKKTFAEDLTEGKFSYPIVRAINDYPDDNQVMNILSQHTSNSSLKLYCVKHLLELGALEQTVLKLAKLEERCSQLIVKYGNNPLLSEVIQKLTDLHRTPDGHLRFITPRDLNYDSFDHNEISIASGHINPIPK
ncbi:unnamed protein product [Schistosoma curassoni]|uniref:CARD domain-containing protein n=1 Tax=Schistosoma curassoni TaxID=6186 RepID=A0A183JM15_9TREM|nr:unnamed protein product [Schistosoma curassoni]